MNSDGSDRISLPPPSKAHACSTVRNQIRDLVRMGRGSATTDLAAKITTGGTYTLTAGEHFVDAENAVVVRFVDKKIEVMAPPAPSTKDCTPAS